MSAGVCDTESVYCFFFFYCPTCDGEYMSDFFCPDELTHSLRVWILVFFWRRILRWRIHALYFHE